MKQYVIDELRADDAQRLQAHLEEKLGSPALGTVYWLLLPEEMLSTVQAEHQECQPFYFALDLDEAGLSCELLVRAQNIIRCNCITYADARQREWLINYIDSMMTQLEIIT